MIKSCKIEKNSLEYLLLTFCVKLLSNRLIYRNLSHKIHPLPFVKFPGSCPGNKCVIPMNHIADKYQSVSEISFPPSEFPNSCDIYTRFRLHSPLHRALWVCAFIWCKSPVSCPLGYKLWNISCPSGYIWQKAFFKHALNKKNLKPAWYGWHKSHISQYQIQ